jgi:signal transduction histidine kinase
MLIDMFSVGTTEKGIVILFNCDDSVPEVIVTDEQRIKQVLLNLLSNAMKFTAKGSITVNVHFNPEDSFLITSVTDTGVGIKSSDQNKLFKVFGKLSATSSINANGIGLGLNICKQICEAFEGGISVSSVLG